MPSDSLTPVFLRERAGLTQREVAIALGKRESTISDWERFAHRPKLHLAEVLKLQRLYQCSLEELVQAFDRIAPDE
jgi:transcriptional regulator with XRE-family HTH domain